MNTAWQCCAVFCNFGAILFFSADQLPDAEKLFSTVKKPSFLDSKSKNTDIDWDAMAKSKVSVESVVCSNTHTVPPPVSYEPQSSALKPTLGDPHEALLTDRKRHVKSTDAESAGLYESLLVG